jgi:hypothetical protein
VAAALLIPILIAACLRTAAADVYPAAIVHAERYTGSPPFTTDAFAFDTTITPAVGSSVQAQFDRTRGTLALSATSSGRLAAGLRLVEEFDVAGVPPGTPVGATIEFHPDGWSEQNWGGSGCGVLFEGRLASGADSVLADANHGGPSVGSRSLLATLALPIRFVAGTPVESQFVLVFGTGPGGGAHAEAAGRYAVSGLPPGVHAIACPGADVTPVRPRTWGALKRGYR